MTAETRENSNCEFSPSVNHRRVMEVMRQELSYRGGDVAAWQGRLRKKLGELLGDVPGERVELNVRVLWEREHPLGRVQKVVFASEPGADVPAFVCLPAKAKPPYTFFVCLQGHSTGMHNSLAVDREDNEKPIAVEGDRDFALGCMERGIAALCIEQRAFGERRELLLPNAPQNCESAQMQALMLGRTLIGERVWDVDRAIDYLAWRGDADMRRVGVMGNSGGGTTSMFAAAMLPRIAFAMPSCYFCTFRDSIMAMHHCMCNYVPGLLKAAEMADVMGLFAPRPLVVVAGRKDEIFPIEATEREFARLKGIYEAAGAGEKCRLVVGPEGHRFYAEMGWGAMMGMMG